MQTAEDISKVLPTEIRQQFEAHYARQAPIQFETTDGTCSRCGAMVVMLGEPIHEMWHKNVSCQLWMMSHWSAGHMRHHDAMEGAIQSMLEGLLGMAGIDVNGLAEGDTLMKDGEPVAHVHEDGTTHAH